MSDDDITPGEEAVSPQPEAVAPADVPPAPQPRRRSRGDNGSSDQAAPRRATRSRAAKRSHAADVAQLHVLIGGGLQLVPRPPVRAAGGALAQVAPDAGRYWDRVAREYPAVYAVLDRLTQATLVGEGLSVYAPVILAVLAATRAPTISSGDDRPGAPGDPLLDVLAGLMAQTPGPDAAAGYAQPTE